MPWNSIYRDLGCQIAFIDAVDEIFETHLHPALSSLRVPLPYRPLRLLLCGNQMSQMWS